MQVAEPNTISTSPGADTVRELQSRAERSYVANLRSSAAAIKYLLKRGISSKSAASFGLGYATAYQNNLETVVRDYAAKDIVASGLIAIEESQRGQRTHTRFRDRIMFPIRDMNGVTVGFGGRSIHDHGGSPKYLNSPETEIFHKRDHLYGLHENRNGIATQGRALWVEGYFDVIAMHQAGFDCAVASLGTACTNTQIEMLLEHTDNIFFCFDGDAPGKRAADAALLMALPYANDKRQFSFVFFPPEHDPDSFLIAYGPAALEEKLRNATNLHAALIDLVSAGCDLTTMEGRSRCIAHAKSCWASLPDGANKDDLLSFCSALIGLNQAALLELWTGSTS